MAQTDRSRIVHEVRTNDKLYLLAQIGSGSAVAKIATEVNPPETLLVSVKPKKETERLCRKI